MFSSKIYSERRQILINSLRAKYNEGQAGIVILIGNVEAPAQGKDNCYKFRQDSTWLYYLGLDFPSYAAIIDLDSSKECIYADDYEIGDIIWMGPQPSVEHNAYLAGVKATKKLAEFDADVLHAKSLGRRIHFIPPTRYYNQLKLIHLGLDPTQPSKELILSIIEKRLVKDEHDIEQLEDAAVLGYDMHTMARRSAKIGHIEQEAVGKMEAVTLERGWGVSFATILSQHGEILHNHIHDKVIEEGKLLLVDAGAENNMHYASDYTRTYPTSGKFTKKQADIYEIVYACNELAYQLSKPGVEYRDVHIAVARHMLDALSQLDLVRGDLDAMVAEGIAGLFMPHGLGHNMGLDVHDMEDLGETLVGYDPGQVRANQLGLGSLRMARKLKKGYVVTDEPGIYFIPDLIAKWKKEGTDKGFVNYDKLSQYLDFGGIRLEDDLLITEDGCRRIGAKRLPISIKEVEEVMAQEA